MGMSAEHRVKMIVATRESAAALSEDIEHLREVLAGPTPKRAELRRMSAIMRRLLVDGDLSMIGGPRIGKICILGPDNKPAYANAERTELAYFSSAGVKLFGVELRAASAHYEGKYQPLLEFDPDRRVPMRIDNFLAQRVLCVSGDWSTRKEVIKYLANIASGVHSNTPVEPSDLKVARARRVMAYKIVNGSLGFHFDGKAIADKDPQHLNLDPTSLDPALVELLAAIRFLVESPDINRLENVIHQELA